MIKPLSDFVFLTFEKQKKTEKGVLISDVSKKKGEVGKVIAIGPGKLDRHGNLVKPILKKGDMVAISPFLVQDITIEGKKYFVIRESQIFAKL